MRNQTSSSFHHVISNFSPSTINYTGCNFCVQLSVNNIGDIWIIMVRFFVFFLHNLFFIVSSVHSLCIMDACVLCWHLSSVICCAPEAGISQNVQITLSKIEMMSCLNIRFFFSGLLPFLSVVVAQVKKHITAQQKRHSPGSRWR